MRDYPLPFFAEVVSNLHAPSKDPEALRWLARFDGFIFVVAWYNHSMPAGSRTHSIKRTRSGITRLSARSAGWNLDFISDALIPREARRRIGS